MASGLASSIPILYKEVVNTYLLDELSEGRVAGPFAHSLIPHDQIRRFGVIPNITNQALGD